MMPQRRKQKTIPPNKNNRTGKTRRSYGVSGELILPAILGIVFVIMCSNKLHIQDDAFITFRYVDNFLNGNGLVFNQGERVEGFTSILWVLILSLVRLMHFDLLSFSQNAGIGFGIATIFLTYLLSGFAFDLFFNGKVNNRGILSVRNIISMLPAAMLTFTGAFQYWSVSGMEVTLFISLTLAAVYVYIKSVIKNNSLIPFSILISLTSLVRPEGILLFTVIIVHYCYFLFRSLSELKKEVFFTLIMRRESMVPLSIFLITNIILLVFRLVYYGYPLPNTFYAKTGISFEYFLSGIGYTADFLKTYLLYGSVLLAAFFILQKKELRLLYTLLFSIIGVFFIYTIVVGGDVLPLYRFLLPVLPLIYILFSLALYMLIASLRKVNVRLSNRIISIITLSVSSIIIYYNYNSPSEKIGKFAYYENQLVQKMSSTGQWLARKQSESPDKITVAATTIGAVSYYSDVKVIDMLGLTDETIAHNPKPITVISGDRTGWKERNYNIDYVLSRKPDYIYFSTGIKPSAYAERALFLSEDFVYNYYPYYFNAIGDFVETIYKRKDRPAVKDELTPFKSNPAFDSGYVSLYNELLNIKNKPEFKDEALALYARLERTAPLNFETPGYLLAIILERNNQKEKAFNIMLESANRDDYLSLAHFYLGRKYSIQKNYPLAKLHFDLVQRYNPEYFDFQTRRRAASEN